MNLSIKKIASINGKVKVENGNNINKIKEEQRFHMSPEDNTTEIKIEDGKISSNQKIIGIILQITIYHNSLINIIL